MSRVEPTNHNHKTVDGLVCKFYQCHLFVNINNNKTVLILELIKIIKFRESHAIVVVVVENYHCQSICD